MAKENAKVQSSVKVIPAINGEGSLIQVDFPRIGTSSSFRLSLDHPLYRDFAEYGVSVLARATCAGKESDQKALEAVEARFSAFNEGEWAVERGGDSEAQPSGGFFVEALSRLSGKTIPEVREQLGEFSKEVVAAMKKKEAVVNEIAKIKEERGIKTVTKTKITPDTRGLEAALGIHS